MIGLHMFEIAKLTKELKLEHWGPGEWVDEPDSFEFEYQGFVCFGKRLSIWDAHKRDYLSGGYWNGYVALPKDHPLHEKNLSDGDFPDIDVHGGITYCDFEPIDWGDPSRFIIGFDCAHHNDVWPSMIEMKKKIREDIEQKLPNIMKQLLPSSTFFQEIYRNYDFIVAEVKKMADQMKELKTKYLLG